MGADARAGAGGSEASEPLLQFFVYEHLRDEALRAASRPFCLLALKIAATYPRNPERTVLLRKLLEAKDAAVRCWLYTVPVGNAHTPTAAQVTLDLEKEFGGTDLAGRAPSLLDPALGVVPVLGD